MSGPGPNWILGTPIQILEHNFTTLRADFAAAVPSLDSLSWPCAGLLVPVSFACVIARNALYGSAGETRTVRDVCVTVFSNLTTARKLKAEGPFT